MSDIADVLAPRFGDAYIPASLAQTKRMIALAIAQHHQIIVRRFAAHEQGLQEMGDRMTSIEQQESERWAEVGTIAGLVLAELDSVRQQVGALVADQQTAVDAGVAAERERASQADLDRLDALASQLRAALPVEVPEVPTPEPGEPAVDPGSGQSSDDVIADAGSGDAGSGDGSFGGDGDAGSVGDENTQV